jgi:hypothetical protein
MKFKVDWTSPKQGIRSTTVEAINMGAAREQVESMYAGIEGFNAFCISPVFDKIKPSELQQGQKSSITRSPTSEGSDDEFLSTSIGGLAIALGAACALLGLLTMPLGIFAILAGAAVGWLGMKLAFWLGERGW